jgi:uncharacterized protein YndB with AHSA1/START domain
MTNTQAAETAHTIDRTFRRTTSVRIEIATNPDAVWALLTDAARFPEWNSTVTSLEGSIERGERLALKVPLAPKRTFRPKVVELVANERMVWAEGFAPMFRGVRTFTVTATDRNTTEFTMTEVLSGAMLPMIRKSLPDFAPAFTTYAADLKRAAETRRVVVKSA